MRFVFKNAPKRSEEEVPTPGSSVVSVGSLGSYDWFDAVCTDSSDGDYFLGNPRPCHHHQQRHQQRHHNHHRPDTRCSRETPISSASPDAMQSASTPLLAGRTAPAASRATPVAARAFAASPESSRADYESLKGGTSLTPSERAFSSTDDVYKYTNEPNKKQSSIITIFAVWNTIMGSSLLTMAWGVERAGLGAALALTVCMGALCLYTAHVLLCVRAHHAGGSTSWEVHDLCRVLLGRWAEALAQAFSLLVMLGANIVYWILMTNFLYFTVNYFMDVNASNTTEYRNSSLVCPKATVLRNTSLLLPPPPPDDESPYWGLHSTVPVYIAALVYPLLNFRTAAFFTKFNSLGTLSVVYLLVFVAVKGWRWGVHVASWPGELRAGRNAAVLSGMLALSFYIHNIIITIMSGNARQENNSRDLTIAFMLVTMTYVLVGGIFYICFPLAKYCIEDNILNNFEMHDAMSAAARVLLLFQVVTVYPLIAYMFRKQTLDLLPLRDKQHRGWVAALNVAIVVVCILFACFCPNIGTIVRYTGAVSGLVHIFTLPSLLQVRSLQLRGELIWWKALFYLLITLVGAVNLLAQFFIQE